MENNKNLLVEYTKWLDLNSYLDNNKTFYLMPNDIVDKYVSTLTNNSVNQYFPDNLIKTVIHLNEKYNKRIIFCGSFGLVLNGFIEREIHDIDCFTLDNHYGTQPIVEGEHNFGSGHFMVGNVEVFRFCERINDMDIDIMYREDSLNIKYSVIDFHGTLIKVELPASAINAKKQYLASNQNHVNKEKHLGDLEQIKIKLGLGI